MKAPPPFRRVLLFLAAGLLISGPVTRAGSNDSPDAADDPTVRPPDKSQYNLFNPTPDNLLRSFSTSRPDQTTGAHSVDAGHYYLEIGLFAYTLDLGSTRTSTWNPLQSSHFRAGLTNNIELELIYDGFSNQTTREVTPGTGGRRSDTTINGSGNTTVRTRFIIFGNDGGPVSFGIMPQVNLPTATARIEPEHFTGSTIFTFDFKLPDKFDLTVHNEPGITRNSNDTDYAFMLTSGVTLKRNIYKKETPVEPYIEYFDTWAAGPGGSVQEQVDFGVRWRPIHEVQFDFGCNFGVSRSAPDFQPFAGVSTRF